MKKIHGMIFVTIFIFYLNPIFSIEFSEKEKKLIEKFIVLPVDGYDKVESDKIIRRVLNVNNEFLQEFKEKGGIIKLINTNITGDENYSYLKGITPRGWEKTGKTWDDIPGIGGQIVLVRIGYSEPSLEHGHATYNLELHELAHGLDYYVFNSISATEDFKKVMKESKRLFGVDPYFSYPEEYFADSFAKYYLSPKSRQEMKRLAPSTYEFIKALH